MPRTSKKTDVKETEKKVAATATEKKEEAVKTTEKKKPGRPKATASKTTTMAAKKTTTTKKTGTKEEIPAVKADVFVQFSGNEYSESNIMEQVVAAWEAEGKKVSAIKRAKLYIKPEEGKAYYVINEGLKNGTMGAVDL